jgi:hypothetical protein
MQDEMLRQEADEEQTSAVAIVDIEEEVASELVLFADWETYEDNVA